MNVHEANITSYRFEAMGITPFFRAKIRDNRGELWCFRETIEQIVPRRGNTHAPGEF
jgi:hypothetical protein